MLATALLLLSGLAAPDAQADIFVTALRTPLPRERVASSLTVLDREAIERAQAPLVSDLLIRTPGISFTRNGGYGTNTAIRIRGAEADQTVLVIDGVKLADPSSTGGGYNFANLLTGDAARIEILRGPQSILWGSQAIGGVVNIATAAAEQPLEGAFQIEAGSRRTVDARAAIGGRSGAIDWRLAGNRFSTDGISAISPRYGGREKDGYANAGATGRIGIRLAPGLALSAGGYYASSRTDIDSAGSIPDSPEFARNTEWLGYAALTGDLFDGTLKNRIAFSQTEIDRININPARKLRKTTLDAHGRTRRYEYQGRLGLADGWNAVFGAEREEQRMRSASPGDSLAPYRTIRADAAIDSVFAQINGRLVDGLTLTGGLRHDHHSTFGGNSVFGAGGAWSLFDGHTVLRASYGEGFKAPTLYQLYSEYGNTALAPERAHGWDAGIEQLLLSGRLTLSATWFERTTRNLISFNGCPAAGGPPLCLAPGTGTQRSGYYANVQRSRAQGIELAGTARLGRLSLDANYSWTAAEDRSPGPNFGNQLPRRPRHAANGAASYTLPCGASATIAVRWSGKTLDAVQTSAAVPPFVNHAYTLVDLRAELPLAHGVRLFGRVENLFDEYYETARRYGSLGRSIYAGLSARM